MNRSKNIRVLRQQPNNAQVDFNYGEQSWRGQHAQRFENTIEELRLENERYRQQMTAFFRQLQKAKTDRIVLETRVLQLQDELRDSKSDNADLVKALHTQHAKTSNCPNCW